MSNVKIGDREIAIVEFSARKSIRVLKIIRAIGQHWPGIFQAMAEYRRQYAADNYVELDRASAQFQYGGPQPIVTARSEDGSPIEFQRDADGNIEFGPPRLAHMSDADWQASGQKLRLPQEPDEIEIWLAVFPDAFDAAEELMLELCALVTVTNDELGQAARDGGADGVTELLHARGEHLLDEAKGDQLLELLVVASETVEKQFGSKVRELGDRVGNLRKLFGLTPESRQEEPTTTKTTQRRSRRRSSIDSQPPTGGASDGSSTEHAGDSSPASAAA